MLDAKYPLDTIVGEEPKNPIDGSFWQKPINGDFSNGSLVYIYNKGEWILTYNAGDVNQMLEILTNFGEVKMQRINNEFWVAFFPRNHGPLWYYSSKTTLFEALDELIKKSIKMKIIN